MFTMRRAVLVTASTAVLLAGCGGDTDQTGELAQEATDVERYCSLSAELDAQADAPTEEQLQEIENVAPPEIAEDVATLVESVRNQDFGSEAAAEAEQALLAWEEENCTTESMEVEPGEAVTEATS